MEIWKPVSGYNGFYEVSNKGNVRSVDRMVKTGINNVTSRIVKGRLLKPALKKSTGYYSVDLSKKNKVSTTSIHRLVAIEFVPNPKCLNVVNHINGIKTDNRPENLEWVTHKQNHHHAGNMGLRKNVGQYQNKKLLCVETGIVFKNSVEAAKWLLKNDPEKTILSPDDYRKVSRNIRGCATGRTPKSYGYTWKDI